MKIVIKSWTTPAVHLYEGEHASLREAVEHCARTGISLADARLVGANLAGANLAGANLDGANLRAADLRSADLAGALLDGALFANAILDGANFAGADLTGAHLDGADLDGADLTGAKLAGAHLAGAHLDGATGLPDLAVPRLAERVLVQIEQHPETYDQAMWHSECGTRHCAAGWAVRLAGVPADVERRLGTGHAATLALGLPLGTWCPWGADDDPIPWLRELAGFASRGRAQSQQGKGTDNEE